MPLASEEMRRREPPPEIATWDYLEPPRIRMSVSASGGLSVKEATLAAEPHPRVVQNSKDVGNIAIEQPPVVLEN